jgi:hypothetical protein
VSLTAQQIDVLAAFVLAQLDPTEAADRPTAALYESVRQMQVQAHALNPARPDHALAHEVICTALAQVAQHWSDLPSFPNQREYSGVQAVVGPAGHVGKRAGSVSARG